MKNKLIQLSSLSALWLMNPVITACSQEEPEFSFGEEELLDIMNEINETDWEIEEDSELRMVQFELSQEQAEQAAKTLFSMMNAAKACGTRSFLATAEACLDISSVAVEGWMTVEDPEGEIEEVLIEGRIEVMGHDLDNAMISLSHDQGVAYLNGSMVDDELVLELDSTGL